MGVQGFKNDFFHFYIYCWPISILNGFISLSTQIIMEVMIQNVMEIDAIFDQIILKIRGNLTLF